MTTDTTTFTAADVARQLNEAATGSLGGGVLVFRRTADTYSGGEWLSGDSRPRLGADERALQVRNPRHRWTAAEVAEQWMSEDELLAAERARWAEWA